MTTANIGVYSVDPPALDTIHGFDPESLTGALAISDALVAISPDGEVVPSLATSWTQTGPLTMELTLRQGVGFHNGEPFDADSVVATLHAHRHPTPGPAWGFFSTIASIDRLDRFRVRITTAMPDAMLLRRLTFFSIYPRGARRRLGGGGW